MYLYIPFSEREYTNIEDLLGKVLSKVVEESDRITFETTGGEKYVMYHDQDCCESVEIEDVIGDFMDLIGEPITMAEEVTEEGEHDWGTSTWTFYKLATVKGYVTIRWLGESNGYYSESVDFIKLKEDE